MQRKYNKGDRFFGPGIKQATIVSTTRYGHTTGLELEVTDSDNAVQTINTNTHKFTRQLKRWGWGRVAK